MPTCQRCVVTGRVQGVYYRASTQRQAEKLGCTGWVRNLPDGNVEVLICGDDYQVEEMKRWLWMGPTHAKVHRVSCRNADAQDFDDFRIAYD